MFFHQIDPDIYDEYLMLSLFYMFKYDRNFFETISALYIVTLLTYRGKYKPYISCL